jgi:uncharacterized membrane protein
MMIGIFFAFLSAIITGISLFLQKMSLIKISNWKQAIKSPKWIFSISLGILAFYFFLFSLKFERLIIIQPIGYASLLVTIILEIYILKEKLELNEILSIILFFIGSLFITNAFCNIFNILCW